MSEGSSRLIGFARHQSAELLWNVWETEPGKGEIWLLRIFGGGGGGGAVGVRGIIIAEAPVINQGATGWALWSARVLPLHQSLWLRGSDLMRRQTRDEASRLGLALLATSWGG